MRFRSLTAIGLGLVFVLGALPACGGRGGGGSRPIVPDGYEPNDSFATCSPITLDFLATDLTLDEPLDEDHFCFTLADDSWLGVTASPTRTNAEMDVVLYDATGLPLITSLSQQGAEVISAVLYAGSYSLRVFSPTAMENIYSLDIQAQTIIFDPPPDPLEAAGDDAFCGPDIGDIAAAPFIVRNRTIHDIMDVDYSCFTLQAAATVEVRVRFVHSRGNLDLELLDSSAMVIDFAMSLNDDETLSAAVPAGTYSIRIFSPSGGTNWYDLTVWAQ